LKKELKKRKERESAKGYLPQTEDACMWQWQLVKDPS